MIELADATGWRRLRSSVMEFFLLEDLRKHSAKVVGDVQGQVCNLVEQSRQHAAAADVLCAGGQRAVALHHARQALMLAVDAVALHAGSKDPAQWAGHLLAAGMSSAACTRVMSVVAEVEGMALPPREDDVGLRHARVLEAMLAQQRALVGAVAPSTWDAAQIRAVSILRTGMLAVLVVAGLGVAWRLAFPPPWAVQASETIDVKNPKYAAVNVVDGRTATEWILPDARPGWVELKTKRPRRVQGVRLLNSHNAPHNDRATREFRVELYAGSALVAARDGVFTELAVLPEWMNVDVSGADVDRVRVAVRSWHKTGGGLAEIEVK